MYSWHILLLPIAVVALVAAHVLLVRRHGVVPPFELEKRAALAASPAPATAPRRGRRRRADGAPGGADVSRLGRLTHPKDDTRPGAGATTPYDLVKELCIAVGVIGLLAVLLTILFSSPDDKPSTVAQWSRQLPQNFVTTASEELAGTSGTATYGPPYNHNGTVSKRGSSSPRNGSG